MLEVFAEFAKVIARNINPLYRFAIVHAVEHTQAFLRVLPEGRRRRRAPGAGAGGVRAPGARVGRDA
jgi:hypothetical protein